MKALETSPPTPTRALIDLTGTTALITGVGSRGQVGEVVARSFAERGARVAIVDRDKERVMARASDLAGQGLEVQPYDCDLSDSDAIAGLVKRITPFLTDGLHSLVNLAGGFAPGSAVADTAPEAWHKMFAINLTTAFLATSAFLPLLRSKGGSIVFFSSASALPGATVTRLSAYSAAKGSVITLMRAVAAEERESGVRANALAPTSIRTDANLHSMGEKANYVSRETIAAWVMWLCAPVSGPVSGQVIKVG